MNHLENITALITVYKTQDLAKRCVETFMKHYPGVKLVLIDNGSQNSSTEYIRHMARDNDNIACIINEKNVYHGPAMDQGIRFCATRYVFTLDSDCEILKSGFLEEMLKLFKDPGLYAVGRLVYTNRYGHETEARHRKLIKYIHPHAMLLDREKYLRLKSFTHHGSPCIKNMRDAEKAGYKVSDFPVDDFIVHRGRGTCSRYGYGLGPRTSFEHLLSKLGLFV